MLKNKKVLGILQLLLSLTLLGWLIWRVGFGEVTRTLIDIRWSWYLPALLLFLLNIIIRAYRWYILLHSLNEGPTFGHLLYLYFIGFFANNFIPSGFGGDVVKVVGLRQTYGRGAEALSSVVMDRVTGLLGSSMIALAALIFNYVSHMSNIELPPILWAIVTIMSVGIPTAFLLVRLVDPFHILVARFPTIRNLPKYEKMEQLADTVRRYPFAALWRSLATSLPFTFSLILVQYSTARALSVDLSLGVFSLFVPVIAIINLLPISFNGLGVREGVYQFLFVPIGVSSASALAMSLAYFFLRFSAGLFGGLLYSLRNINHLMRSPHAENL